MYRAIFISLIILAEASMRALSLAKRGHILNAALQAARNKAEEFSSQTNENIETTKTQPSSIVIYKPPLPPMVLSKPQTAKIIADVESSTNMNQLTDKISKGKGSRRKRRVTRRKRKKEKNSNSEPENDSYSYSYSHGENKDDPNPDLNSNLDLNPKQEHIDLTNDFYTNLTTPEPLFPPEEQKSQDKNPQTVESSKQEPEEIIKTEIDEYKDIQTGEQSNEPATGEDLKNQRKLFNEDEPEIQNEPTSPTAKAIENTKNKTFKKPKVPAFSKEASPPLAFDFNKKGNYIKKPGSYNPKFPTLRIKNQSTSDSSTTTDENSEGSIPLD